MSDLTDVWEGERREKGARKVGREEERKNIGREMGVEWCEGGNMN